MPRSRNRAGDPRPLVLVTPSTQRTGVEFADVSLSLSRRYTRAVVAAGGLPVVAACEPEDGLVADWVSRCDGVLLTGGDDVQPGLYASGLPAALERTVKGVDPARDLLELLLIDEVFRQHKPLLAICRGQQLLNVALGGTLIVDLATQRLQAVNHARFDRKDDEVHEVTLTPGSLLARMAGKPTLGVNSTHHQAVDRVAEPLRVSATSADGVIEGLELDSRAGELLPFLLAVQFHPERLIERQRVFLEIFRAFIQACVAQRNELL